MNSLVTIKSIPNGIKVILDENCSFSDIIEELGKKFRESSKFFKGGKLCVTFEGRELTDLEETTLVEIMEKNGEFNVLYIISQVTEDDTRIQKAIATGISNSEDIKGFGAIYPKTVYKGEHLQFSSGVLICGSVEPGALIKASGNVIILGGLYGSINIDVKEGLNPFVFSLEMHPERIKIGDLRYYSPEKKWSIKPKYQGKLAYIKDEKITVGDCSDKIFKDLFKG